MIGDIGAAGEGPFGLLMFRSRLIYRTMLQYIIEGSHIRNFVGGSLSKVLCVHSLCVYTNVYGLHIIIDIKQYTVLSNFVII